MFFVLKKGTAKLTVVTFKYQQKLVNDSVLPTFMYHIKKVKFG
jgi:hypothetical protein